MLNRDFIGARKKKKQHLKIYSCRHGSAMSNYAFTAQRSNDSVNDQLQTDENVLIRWPVRTAVSALKKYKFTRCYFGC